MNDQSENESNDLRSRLKSGLKAAGKSIVAEAKTTNKSERQRAKDGLAPKRPSQGAIGSFVSAFKDASSANIDKSIESESNPSNYNSQNASKFCTACGMNLAHDAKFCEKCGKQQ